MSGSESLDPEEPGDPSPHELGVYCMYVAIRTLIINVSLCIYVYRGPKYPHMHEYCFCYII